MANAVVSYVLYIRKTIWPVDLCRLLPPCRNAAVWKSRIASHPGCCVRTWLPSEWPAHAPTWLVGWFWYLGTLVPVIGLVQIGSHAMADRYTYIPLLGLFIALAWGAIEIVRETAGT